MAPAKPAATAPMATAKPAALTPAKPMNYDCTKAGNKNKAACKNVVVPPAAAPMAAKPMAAAPAAKPMAMAPAAAPAAMAPAARPRAAAAPKPVNPNEVTATLKNGKTVHYDCSKAGNKDKKACGATPK
jgi:hypothetical protein